MGAVWCGEERPHDQGGAGTGFEPVGSSMPHTGQLAACPMLARLRGFGGHRLQAVGRAGRWYL